jgi:regulatory protein
MATVVGLRRPRPGEPTVEVVLGSGERVRVHDRRIVEHGLHTGAALDPAVEDALRGASIIDSAERRALRLIARRPRSQAELARRMGDWGLAPADAGAVLDRLAAMGVVDDQALAVAVVSARRERGHGRLRIAADLERLAVDPDTGAEAAATSAAGEVERARHALGGRGGEAARDPAAVRRAAAFLARRGFDTETVAAVLDLDVDA